MPSSIVRALRNILVAGFLVGGINGTYAYLKDHKDFNFEDGIEALTGVFIISGLSGAAAYIMRSPLEKQGDTKHDDTNE